MPCAEGKYQQQVAKYQNVVLSHVAGAEWQLLSLDEMGDGVYLAPVNRMLPQVSDTFPAHVLLHVPGSFPDGCGDLGRVIQRRNGNRFAVVINGDSGGGTVVLCTMGVVPFMTTISLPVYGLSAGEYRYDVNGTTGTFELSRDNTLPGDCPNASRGWCASNLLVDWTIEAAPTE